MEVYSARLSHTLRQPAEVTTLPQDQVGGEVVRAVALARAAQPVWAGQPVRERLTVVRHFRHAVAAEAQQLAATVRGGQRSAAETLAAEVLPLADACRFLERVAPRLLAPRRLRARYRPFWLHGVRSEVRREPFGVVLIIAPANYPVLLPGVQIVQALVAGNAVVCKPGPGGALAATAIARQLVAAGLDPRLVQVLPDSTGAGQAAVTAGVDKVLLTGSASTGANVLGHLAPQLVPATMELAGCDAMFVRADADLELVVQALAFSLRLNGGATCIAPRRVFVAQELSAALESRLAHAVSAMAPCTVEAATWTRVRALITSACEAGACLRAGTLLPQHAMTPLVVTGASPTMRLLQEDVFAPVLALVPVQDDAEALAAAAQCPYALGATIFGAATGARVLAQRVRAGAVVINDVIVPTADPRLPFGGRGRSGFGVTRGAEGLLELTTTKAIALRRGRWRPHFEVPTRQDAVLFQAYITAAHGASWLGRAAAWYALVRTAISRRQWQQGQGEEKY